MSEWKVKIEITATKACFTGGAGFCDAIDNIMFVPLDCPFRYSADPDSLNIKIDEKSMRTPYPYNDRYFEVDLTRWRNEEARMWICTEIIKRLIGLDG